MRIIKIADMHLGLPGKTQDILWAARKTLKLAKTIGCEIIMGYGDLFDNRDAVPLEALYAAHEIFLESKELGINWIWFPGNHDMHMKHEWANKHSLLAVNKNVEVIDKVTTINLGGVDFNIIPYIHDHAAYNQVLEEVSKNASEDSVLSTHVGTNKAKLNSCFLSKNWSDTNLDETKFRRVYTGHYHIHQQVGDNTWYIGSPVPLRTEEGGVPHGVIIYDTDKKTHSFINFMAIKDANRPADYLTFINPNLDEIEKLENIAGNHIRIMLEAGAIIDGEKHIIRQKLLDHAGAKSVKFGHLKAQPQISVATVDNVNTTDIRSVFPNFLERRKIDLKQYDREKLERFNIEIVESALMATTERDLELDDA